jgi:hypothetical protein
LFYGFGVPDKSHHPRAPSALSFKVGRWAEAHATGWGLAALVVLAMVAAGVVVAMGPGLLPH